MLIHGTKFDAAQIAPAVRQVHCEKCGCDYSYEMVRRGTGAASTVYGLFPKSRRNAAAAEAAQNLQVQLEQATIRSAVPTAGGSRARWSRTFGVGRIAG